MVRPTVPADARFIPKVDMLGDDECWEWTGRRLPNGYGNFRDTGGAFIGAHRFAHLLWKGPIREGNVVMHVCDNPPCVNPSHLMQGTMADNMADRDAKGHGRPGGRGERTW